MTLNKNIFIVLALASFLSFWPLANSHAQFYSAKPLFVEISTEWCGACKILKPTIEDLKREYGGLVNFVTLDATSDETLTDANRIAASLGISDFFNNNKNAFPRIGVFCSNSFSPDHNLLGARGKQEYKTILDEIVYKGACNIESNADEETASSEENRPDEADFTEISGNRPEEPTYPEILGDRPSEPILSGRPDEPTLSGRPNELSFWQVGEPIPLYAYFQFVRLPECTGGTILCANHNAQGGNIQAIPSTEPIFKPFNPNATRNEKELDSVKKGIKS